DDRHADIVRRLRDWGEDGRYRHVLRGFNYRMEAFQGAILTIKLRHLSRWIDRRRALARLYDAGLAGIRVDRPTLTPGTEHASHLYSIRSDRRDDLRAHLSAKQIQTAVHYPTPVHMQEAYLDLGGKPGDFPVSEAAARTVLSLPLNPM